ncbi:MAG: hypothetical protein AAF231_10580 [Pseudomonadota bacterium]
MRPIFTIHAGEYLFGKKLKNMRPNADLWLPVKDKGIDFLLTDPDFKKPVGVQVKMSKDYSDVEAKSEYEKALVAGGWFTFSRKKLEHSNADVWSLILVPWQKRETPQYINLRPHTLLNHLEAIHGRRDSYDLYPSVFRLKGEGPKKTHQKLCVETRGLRASQRSDLVSGSLDLGPRDWCQFLDNWKLLESIGNEVD